MIFRIFVSTVLAVIMLGQTRPVHAATYDVSCNTKKLIESIAHANATPADDTINLRARCTYILRSVDNLTLGETGLPLIADTAIAGTLTINGNGATIERSNARRTPNFRIFTVAVGGDLTLDNVTLRNGNLPTHNGGAISSSGSLTVSNSTIADSSALYGGGIAHDSSGTLNVIDSLITGNTSIWDGGGINSAGTLVVTRSRFSSNVSGGQSNSGNGGLGGGILVAEGVATVTDSTFSSNVAHGAAGGAGILNGGCGCGSSVLTVVGSTFTDNYAEGAGGGLFNSAVGTMIVTNSTISGNQASLGGGGGINSQGTLTVIDSTIAGNSANYGGGIAFDSDGTLTVTNSLFDGNISINDGAGINSAGTISVTGSTFSANTAQGLGGGILIAEGIATVTDSTFSGNVTYGAAGGGGILNGGDESSVLTVVGSTFTDNHADGAGGALFNTEGSTMTVTNSTISGNQGFWVGGLWNAGILTVTHSTISSNTSTLEGGGILNYNAGTVTIGSTIVAGNTASLGKDLAGVITSLGYNLIGNTNGATITGDTTGNLTDAAASPLNLGPLQDNGGPTQTRALEAGSVAIDAGDPGFAPPPDFDQRGTGFPRVVGGRIDIGAYESNP